MNAGSDAAEKKTVRMSLRDPVLGSGVPYCRLVVLLTKDFRNGLGRKLESNFMSR